MERSDPRYDSYIQILKDELVPAMGCTELIALAYAAAKAREVLGTLPDRILLQVSGSIIKNVKSVVVPGTNHSKGLETAVIAGMIADHPEKELEILSEMGEDDRRAMEKYRKQVEITVEHIGFGHVFDIIITASTPEHTAKVRIADHHTNVVYLEKTARCCWTGP